jgi:Zn-dependent M28 family amino/carboxypeptidase
VHVGERVIRSLFDSTATLRSIIERIDTTQVPNSFLINDHTVSASWTMQADTVMLRNVVGMIRGEDEPDEYVAVGAHYDHVGVGRPINNDSIFNGADDNASGTTAVLQLAEAFAKAERRPERSVVFMAFSAEERGLLGSRAYVDTPLLPLDKCVGMVNLDMVGRCVNKKVSIGGQGRCPDLIAFNEEENARLASPYTLAYDIDSYFFRSDQANFARKRIPVLFFFTGEHGDYHKVTDEFAKINLVDMVGITRLVARTVTRVTEQERTRYIPAGWEEAR